MKMYKMNLNENILRVKELMGLINESKSDDCYPSDYEPGKEYKRDELSKIFSCIAGESDFPVAGVKESMFPLLPPNKDNPVHHSPSYDPKSIDWGYEEPFDMEKLVDWYKKRISHLSLENFSITPEDIHPDTLDNIPTKENAEGGEKRISVQMNRILKNGIESLTEKEPFVLEIIDGKYKWDEGWNRLIAMVKLFNQNKIPKIEGKAWVAHRIN